MILVTGASGFVGRSLMSHIRHLGLPVRGVIRGTGAPGNRDYVSIADIGPNTDWAWALEGVTAVVHLAGIAHSQAHRAMGLGAEHMRVNHEGTLQLARAARAAGARRFVFLSSVKVYGSNTNGRTLSEADRPLPDDAYGRSKWLAEQGLAQIEGLESVILRPPLIYGPGVKANFLRLLDLTARGVPLPLGCVRNRRSLLGVRNLCTAIDICLRSPRAAGETFLLSDGEDLSTPEIIRRIASSLGRKPRLVRAPPGLIGALAWAVGRNADWQRLAADLAVSSEKAFRDLGFTPPYSFDEELDATVAWYRANK